MSDLIQDVYGLNVSPKNFEEQMQAILKLGKVYSTNDIPFLAKNNLNHTAFIVTFDDGYVDNYTQAIPILEKYAIPATFFITTQYINSLNEFWWDDLERILLNQSKLPQKLNLVLNENTYFYDLKDDCEYDFNKNPNWQVGKEFLPSKRHHILLDLIPLFRQLNHQNRQIILNQLYDWSDVPKIGRTENRKMSEQELVKISKSDLFMLGAHTKTHPVLSQLSLNEQRQEIEDSKKELEKIINTPVSQFAYPHGSSNLDYKTATVQLVKDALFQYAFSVSPQPITDFNNFFETPRFTVPNCKGNEFIRILKNSMLV